MSITFFTHCRAFEGEFDQLQRRGIQSWREAVPELVRLIDLKVWFDLILLAILFVAAAAGIANTAMMSSRTASGFCALPVRSHDIGNGLIYDGLC